MKSYPDGKLNQSDDGALTIASYIEKGRVVLKFGEEVSWLGFDKKSLRAFIDGLEDQYKKL